jgi:hypothetical protein
MGHVHLAATVDKTSATVRNCFSAARTSRAARSAGVRLFRNELYSWGDGAQVVTPVGTNAQASPAQHPLSPVAHATPPPLQIGPSGSAASSTQTVAPGGPTQAPAQQSPAARQAAPVGAQAAAQEKPEVASGRQKPPQHWGPSWQG